MADFMGTGVELPTVQLTGFFSNSWIYVALIFFLGLILIAVVAVILFYKTWNRKIVLFENISGQGYQPTIKTRARIIKLGLGGEELLKTLYGGYFVSAYGRKMGKNTYWYAKGPDGYWYNIVLGDLDTKMAMLDIEPIDRDVRMFHVAMDRLSHQTYGQKDTLTKVVMYGTIFLFLIVLIGGMWILIGKIGEATQALTATAETNKEVIQSLEGVLRTMVNIKGLNATGIVPAG